MKVYLIFCIGLFVLSCGFSEKHSSPDLNQLFKLWDTISYNVLKESSQSNSEPSVKMNHIASTVYKENDVDVLNRQDFLLTLQNDKVIDVNFKKRFMIIEFINSGEKITKQKFLIDLTKTSKNCYAFVKTIKGDWSLERTTDMNETTTHYLMNIPLQTKDQFWGGGINDILLISVFNGSEIRFTPVIFLSRMELEKFESCLQ